MTDTRHPLDIERTLDDMKAIREALGLEQKDLGRMIGVDRSMISKWENRKAVPSFKHLVILHRTLCGMRLQIEASHHAK